MNDLALTAVAAIPAANTSGILGYLDIGVDNPNFSEQWREGRLRVSWPALPNFVSNTDTITFTLQDSNAGPSALSFANTNPIIQGSLTGVASTGPGAGYLDLPLYPGLRGPFQLNVAVTNGAGNNTGSLLKMEWRLE